MPRFAKYDDLPSDYTCNICGDTKPLVEMCLVYTEGKYYLRPRCKDCYNQSERGKRRDYKRKYLQNWRRENAELNESYWKDNPVVREAARVRAANFSQAQKDALAIQRRLRTHSEFISIAEARELLEKYGRCYPTRHGLTKKGNDRCEMIRSRLRIRFRKNNASFGRRMLTSFQIRVMVYEESEEETGLVIPPDEQPVPYQSASNKLKQYHRNQRIIAAEAVS